MRTTTANFSTYLALMNKSVVVAIEFDGVDTKFVSGTFADIGSPPGGVTYNKLIENLTYSVADLDLYRGQYTPATFTVTILDRNAIVTSLLNTINVFNKKVTIKAGFAEINYSDFINLSPGTNYVENVEVQGDFLSYEFFIRDVLFNLNNFEYFDVFSGVGVANYLPTPLVPPLNAGELTTINTNLSYDTQYYGVLADIDNNPDERVKPCVLLDTEIISYETKTANTLVTLARPHGRSTNAAHGSVASLWPGIGFFCDPLRTLLHFLTTGTAGTNGKYDLGMGNFGDDINNHFSLRFGLDYTFVDIDGISRLGYKHFMEDEYQYGHYFHFAFIGNSGYSGIYPTRFNFIEEIMTRFLTPFFFYLYFNGGKIKVGTNDLVDAIENFSAAATLDEDNIESLDGIEHTDLSDLNIYAQTLNHNLDHSDTTINFPNDDDFFFQSSRLLSLPFSKRQGTELNSYGGYADTAARFQQYDNAYMLRTSLLLEPKLIVTLSCHMSTILLEPGDQVYVTLANFPNTLTGSRGLTLGKGLILGQEIDFASKMVRHRVMLYEVPGYVADELGEAIYAINKVAEGSITDKALSVSTDETTTTEAADAYYDNSGTAYLGNVIMFRIRVTQPNYGAGSDFETIELKFSALSSAPAFLFYDYQRYIAFNPQASSAFNVDFYLFNDDVNYFTAPTAIDRVKVDWISTTATGSEVPTVEFIGVWFIDFAT